jgi:predicted dithiol-disulfide oxidoreductase (DUF899 family)
MVEPKTFEAQPGLSCFLADGEDICRTYSSHARGTDQLGGGCPLLT